jgi:hypothetical protein
LEAHKEPVHPKFGCAFFNVFSISGLPTTLNRTSFSFINREDIDFENVNDLKPVQEFELAENPQGDLEYTVKYAADFASSAPNYCILHYAIYSVAKFQNLSSITFHFPGNLGGLDATSVYYIGMKGDFIHARREPVIANYELRPNPAKNQNPAEQMGGAFRPGY